MNYAGILAGGKGTRMGKIDLPKQFLMLGDKPIIVHTIEQFMLCDNIEQIVVAVPENWLSYMQDIIEKYFAKVASVHVTIGGSDRNSTIMNICKYIEENYGIKPEDNLVTHDAVRPFLTKRIIEDNIYALDTYVAVDTVIPATDTIVESKAGNIIDNIPNRKYLYQGQTPQSFKMQKLIDEYNGLSNEEKEILTDACKIFSIKGKEVGIVIGEAYNMKITNPFDYKMAKYMVEEGEKLDD